MTLKRLAIITAWSIGMTPYLVVGILALVYVL